MESSVIFENISGETTHEKDGVVLKTRINSAWQHYLTKTGIADSHLYVSTKPIISRSANSENESSETQPNNKSTGISLEQRATQYQSQEPHFTFDQLIVPDGVRKNLMLATQIISLEPQVFDDWGLRKIEPFPRSALNFYGEPGTGKTLAAHALASHLKCKLLLASYAQIESMYHGEGPKNVEAVFHAAQRDKALLFIDEADSLLSKRLTNVTQGSEQAINSMRSQLLICLEQFKGVVIFATNLVKNYDQAFETRVRNIHFPMPDFECRRQIWKTHLPPQMPLASEVSLNELASVDGLCGREIRNAVIEAALQAAMNNANHVSRQDLLDSIERVKESRIKREDDVVIHPLTDEEQKSIERAIQSENNIAGT